MPNNFDNKVSILSELWMNYRMDEGFKDFIEYNDLGLPLAYIILNELADNNDKTVMYIDETYDLFVAALNIEDKEWESIDQMFDAASK
jgi:hypothetical protein